MATNFDFLKNIDKNLFEIISEAEKLYRDEYFEQCMGQTRKFGENVCKKVLGKNRTDEKTFDDMLATLKDYSNGGEEEKEFISDLYFLKKHGNSAVHSSSVKKDGINALECLKRAFEVAINYSVYNKNAGNHILNLHYDTELLVTGKKTENLADKYQKIKNQNKTKQTTSTKSSNKNKKIKKQSSVMVCKPKKKAFSIYWILVGITFVISLLIVLTLVVMLHIK